MPRCISSTSPEARSAVRYLSRRPMPVTVWPSSRFTKSRGSGRRKSGRRASTRTMRLPSITGASPRRTVSTSGSSGTGSFLFTLDRGFHSASAFAGLYGPGAQRISTMPKTNGTPDAPRDTHFGFRSVGVDDKQALVDEVFGKVAPRYDLMNDLMSGGLHRAWKDVLVTALNPPLNERSFAVLDVAGGTGDV